LVRLKHIDSVRGFAALAVIYAHTAQYLLANHLVRSPAEGYVFTFFTEFDDLGKAGVTIFFAISGFVIPFSLFKHGSQPLRAFFIGRFFRLYPTFWLSIPLALLALYVIPGRDTSLALVLSNMTMMPQFLGQESIQVAYWTLQIEIVFYVLCALLFAADALNNPLVIALVIGALCLSTVLLSAARYALAIKLPVAMPLALLVMFWGLTLRHTVNTPTPAWRQLNAATTVALLAVVLASSLLAYNRDMGYHETWYRYLASYYFAFAVFILLIFHVRITAATCVYLGTISYSVYLFGALAQDATIHLIGNAGIAQMPGHLFIAITMLTAIALSALSYRFVEAPSIALGKRIIGRVCTASPPKTMEWPPDETIEKVV
jgi:peptidoglycan/LPS O-acetylase OafA/YrhL